MSKTLGFLKQTVLAAAISAVGFVAPVFASNKSALESYAAGEYRAAYKSLIKEARGGSVDSKYRVALLYMEGKGAKRSLRKARYWLRQASAAEYPGASDALAVARRGYVPQEFKINIATLVMGEPLGLDTPAPRIVVPVGKEPDVVFSSGPVAVKAEVLSGPVVTPPSPFPVGYEAVAETVERVAAATSSLLSVPNNELANQDSEAVSIHVAAEQRAQEDKTKNFSSVVPADTSLQNTGAQPQLTLSKKLSKSISQKTKKERGAKKAAPVSVYDETLALAEGGSAEAAMKLAWMHMSGEGAEFDDKKARQWVEAARALGSAEAEDVYAGIWGKTEGEDFGEEDSTAKPAEKTPLAEAPDQAELLVTATPIFEQKKLAGIPIQDSKQPESKKVADPTDAASLHALGYKHMVGEGVEANIELALRYFEKSASQGYIKTLSLLGQIFFEGIYIGRDYELAKEWYGLAAERGDAESAYRVGLIFEKGYVPPKSYEDACFWYTKAADKGHVAAAAALSSMYALGAGVERDYGKAFKYALMAAEKGEVTAQFNLAVLFHKGQGTPQNFKLAISWYKKAADQKHTGAMNNLGYMAQFGQGQKNNYVEAHKWYNLAAMMFDQSAIGYRMMMEQQMSGTQVDEAQMAALDWIRNNENGAMENCARNPLAHGCLKKSGRKG